MKREIKFRGKPCYKGVKTWPWVYGTFQYIAQRRVEHGATDNGRLEPRVDKGRIVDLYGNKTEVLYDTVGQFTGLYDKNGTPIYEGDIVEFYDTKSYCINPDCEPHIRGYGTCIYKRVCEVVFADGVFGVESRNEFLDLEVLAWCGLHTEELDDMKEMEENDAYFYTNGYNIDDSIVGIKVIGNIHDNLDLME